MITNNTTTMFEQLCNGFWFVSARAEAYDEVYDEIRYELWIIPKAEVSTIEQARKEAYEISENLLKDIWYDHDDEDRNGCCRFEFINNPTKLKHYYDIADGMYFYLPVDDIDRKIVLDFIKSL